MFHLKLTDINEWLTDNKIEFENLKSQKFPPVNNDFYWTYNNLYEFVQYYNYKDECNRALSEFPVSSFDLLVGWIKKYEMLGQDLQMFHLNYFDWTEEVDADKIKVEKGIYTERMPFINIICFCKIFQLLFWDNIICETELTENEKSKIICQLKAILKDFNMDMNFD
ncbi:MAG TPA: hypothetical protein PK504_08420 [Ferruginibacter sp.]|nr:hypothetical protein [Ferruginibacter sp.]HRE64463.1 hypothetical protein [Ferruginibacter sp.]